jgi:hypothetical protein
MTRLTALLLADAAVEKQSSLNGRVRCPVCSHLSDYWDQPRCPNCGADLTQPLGERLFQEIGKYDESRHSRDPGGRFARASAATRHPMTARPLHPAHEKYYDAAAKADNATALAGLPRESDIVPSARPTFLQQAAELHQRAQSLHESAARAAEDAGMIASAKMQRDAAQRHADQAKTYSAAT